MTDYQRTAAAIRQANPWTESAGPSEGEWTTAELLSQIEHRSGTVKTVERETTRQPTGPRRNRRLLLVASVAALVVLIGAIAIGLIRDSGTDVVEPAPTTVSDAPEAAARQAIDEAFAAFNSGDMETWWQWAEFGPIFLTVDRLADGEYVKAVAGRYDVEECTHRGLNDWAGEIQLNGHGFECAATYTDDFMGAAGIELEMTISWIIGPSPETSYADSNDDGFHQFTFPAAFREWLAAAHPEVEATMEFTGEFDNPAPESVPTALEYVDEFVAQSDVYPLTEPVPPHDDGGLEAANP